MTLHFKSTTYQEEIFLSLQIKVIQEQQGNQYMIQLCLFMR